MDDAQKNLRDEIALLRKALDKSIWFQSHYAGLLNAYDGGKRMIFENGDAWVARLHELEPVPDPLPPMSKGPAGDRGQVGWMGGEFDR